MVEKVTGMLRRGLDALVQLDIEIARQVCAADDEVDRMNRDMYELVRAMIGQGDEDVNTLIHLLSVSRHLERIADHATNIAEDVIYMISGEIVRHREENYTDSAKPSQDKEAYA